MSDSIVIKKKILNFNKVISVSGDKSISIRWVLLSSLANGVSTAKNLLLSEDVFAAINAIKKLGVKTKFNQNEVKIYGKGIDGYKYKKNITIDAQNSGTLGRLILGLLINTPYPIKLIGDKSLSKRDFKRIADPLSKFGANFSLKNNKNLPMIITGSKNPRPIKYFETRGSAQCKSSVIFAGLRTDGSTSINAKKSRNHTELLCKYLKLPINLYRVSLKDLAYLNAGKIYAINNNENAPSDVDANHDGLITISDLSVLENDWNKTIYNSVSQTQIVDEASWDSPDVEDPNHPDWFAGTIEEGTTIIRYDNSSLQDSLNLNFNSIYVDSIF